MQYKDFWFANGSEAGPLTYQFRTLRILENEGIFVGRTCQEFADDQFQFLVETTIMQFNLYILMMFLSLPCLKKPIGISTPTPRSESTQVALQDVLRLLRWEVTQPGLNATKTITKTTSIAYVTIAGYYCYILLLAIAGITTSTTSMTITTTMTNVTTTRMTSCNDYYHYCVRVFAWT